MAAIRCPRAEGRAALLAVLLWPLLLGSAAPAGTPADPRLAWHRTLVDEPIIWYADDARSIPPPAVSDPGTVKETIEASVRRPLGRLFDPVWLVRRVGALGSGQVSPPAADINRLDEVVTSSWFVNRLGLFRLSPAEVAAGPVGEEPDRSRPWVVVAAKTEGVTPGFTIQDARGDRYLLKFDPPGFVGTTTRAGVVSNRILFAAGYNVPQDDAVSFRREDLVAGEGVQLGGEGGRQALTEAGLDSLLGVLTSRGGRWQALASKLLSGRPVGPFDFAGRRHDDANDRIPHQNRRSLRGLRVFTAWLNHFDMKQDNTLDMYLGEPGEGHVCHYLIDLASTLGAGGQGPQPKWGYEYALDPPAVMGRLLSLGLHESSWVRLRRPRDLPEIGYLDDRFFDPQEWKPMLPNTAFAHMTDRDGYWAAKIISAFTREHLAAIVAEAHYQDPRAAEFVISALQERARIILREWFVRVPPLDFFRVEDRAIRFHDLGVERGVYPAGRTRYRVRWAAVTAERDPGRWSGWRLQDQTAVPLADLAADLQAAPAARYPFLALACQVDRGEGWSRTTTVYLARASLRVVALER
jgi:hypothetical protein